MRLKKKKLNWLAYVVIRGDYFLFGLIFIKKIIKPNLKKKTETDSNRPVLVWFFRTKTSSNRFGSVFSVWLDFFSLVWFFPVCLGFIFIFSVWIRFDFVFLF
jgi:hypothetical protein